MPATVAVSAPGKVFLAGGYLVLDRKYNALVFGLSARINAITTEIRTGPGIQLSELVVESPQFRDAQWRYGYHRVPEGGGVVVTQLDSGTSLSRNPFVETTLTYALSYIDHVAGPQGTNSIAPARVLILADNDYYSHDGTTSSAGRFAKFPVALSKANKTGLGSSAALVTALTASLLVHYLPAGLFDPSTDAGRKTLHNLAQAAHCAAQGKVGSGFDVAAAVYGSCQYRRFSPGVLSGLPEPAQAGFAAALVKVVGDEGGVWDCEVRKEASLPDGVVLRMCDVDCGTQTVGMVKKVLAWRAANQVGADRLWDDLQRKNEALAGVLRESGSGKEKLGGSIGDIRALIREMSVESGVPVEPESQTELLDALSAVEGVYGGVVPGAGGFDALALLMKDDEATKKAVEAFLEKWSRERSVKVRLLNVRGEMDGVRQEALDGFQAWL